MRLSAYITKVNFQQTTFFVNHKYNIAAVRMLLKTVNLFFYFLIFLK